MQPVGADLEGVQMFLDRLKGFFPGNVRVNHGVQVRGNGCLNRLLETLLRSPRRLAAGASLPQRLRQFDGSHLGELRGTDRLDAPLNPCAASVETSSTHLGYHTGG